MDGLARLDAKIPLGAFQVKADGLNPSATLTITLSLGNKKRQQTLTADANGEILASRTVTDPDILAALDKIGGAAWDQEAGLMRVAADEYAVEITVA